MGSHTSRRAEPERGAATAEAAMVLPLLVMVVAGLVWLLAVGAAQIRSVDAAREAARICARGDGDAAARAQALRVAPQGSRVEIRHADGEIVVRVSGTFPKPDGAWGRLLPDVEVDAEAVAADEAAGGGP